MIKEIQLGRVPTCELNDSMIVIGLSKKFQIHNDGKPLEFDAKINENGQLVLLGPQLMKPNKTGVNFENKS